ncbi:MAG: signal peptidase I [Lachnospiraceae bacterium]|nr:signal peptidase I [Lachnospiraceae bacterium]
MAEKRRTPASGKTKKLKENEGQRRAPADKHGRSAGDKSKTYDREVLHPLREIDKEIKKRRDKISVRRGYLDLIRNVIVIALIFIIAGQAVFSLTVARGTGMFPAVLDGDICIGYRLTHEFVKNDVVVAKVDGKTIISRVVAREGDRVEISEGGKLFVNGTEQTGEIAFETEPGTKLTYPYTVPDGCVFVLGDYRTHTTDSRNFGPVRVADITSKVVTVLRRRGI